MKRKFIQIILLLLFLYFLWTMACQSQIHIMPEAAIVDITTYLQTKDTDKLTDDDYDFIFQQTGVTKVGVETLRKNHQFFRLREIQNRYFEEPKLKTIRANLVCHQEWIAEETNAQFDAIVEDGDIIVTLASYLGGWRYGHSALVTDAKKGETIEAITYGVPSYICDIHHWQEYPTFVVLRPKKLSEQQKKSVINYALDELQDLRYDLLSFKTDDLEKVIDKTHCSHLIWSAYKQVGLDIDGDGTPIVTPYDILHDDDLEIVQVYGMKP